MPLPVFRRVTVAAASLRRCLVCRRSVHQASVPTEMSAWQIHRYGGPEELQVRCDASCDVMLRWVVSWTVCKPGLCAISFAQSVI